MKKFLCLFLLPMTLTAQDYTGIWTGWLELGGTDIPYEVVIFESGSGLEGYAMTTVEMNDVKNIGIKTVKFSIKKNKLLLEDDELVYSDFNKPPKRNILAAELIMEGNLIRQELTGSYRTRSVDMRDRTSYSGKIFLKRLKEGEPNDLTARLSNMKLYPLRERSLSNTEWIARNEALLAEKKKNGDFDSNMNTDREGKKEKSKKQEKDPVAVNTKGPVAEKNISGAAITENKSDQQTIAKIENKSEAEPEKEKTEIKKKGNRSSKPEGAASKKEERSAGEKENPNATSVKGPPKETIPYNPDPAAEIDSRKIEVIHTYFFSGDSLEITFYDNGTVDGDTISVLLNRKIIIAKKQLTTEPLTEKIPLPRDVDSLELLMYAENLGAFPPNTGILILKDGKSRIDIRFAGDLSRSASIMLRRKK